MPPPGSIKISGKFLGRKSKSRSLKTTKTQTKKPEESTKPPVKEAPEGTPATVMHLKESPGTQVNPLLPKSDALPSIPPTTTTTVPPLVESPPEKDSPEKEPPPKLMSTEPAKGATPPPGRPKTPEKREPGSPRPSRSPRRPGTGRNRSRRRNRTKSPAGGASKVRSPGKAPEKEEERKTNEERVAPKVTPSSPKSTVPSTKPVVSQIKSRVRVSPRSRHRTRTASPRPSKVTSPRSTIKDEKADKKEVVAGAGTTAVKAKSPQSSIPVSQAPISTALPLVSALAPSPTAETNIKAPPSQAMAPASTASTLLAEKKSPNTGTTSPGKAGPSHAPKSTIPTSPKASGVSKGQATSSAIKSPGTGLKKGVSPRPGDGGPSESSGGTDAKYLIGSNSDKPKKSPGKVKQPKTSPSRLAPPQKSPKRSPTPAKSSIVPGDKTVAVDTKPKEDSNSFKVTRPPPAKEDDAKKRSVSPASRIPGIRSSRSKVSSAIRSRSPGQHKGTKSSLSPGRSRAGASKLGNDPKKKRTRSRSPMGKPSKASSPRTSRRSPRGANASKVRARQTSRLNSSVALSKAPGKAKSTVFGKSFTKATVSSLAKKSDNKIGETLPKDGPKKAKSGIGATKSGIPAIGAPKSGIPAIGPAKSGITAIGPTKSGLAKNKVPKSQIPGPSKSGIIKGRGKSAGGAVKSGIPKEGKSVKEPQKPVKPAPSKTGPTSGAPPFTKSSATAVPVDNERSSSKVTPSAPSKVFSTKKSTLPGGKGGPPAKLGPSSGSSKAPPKQTRTGALGKSNEKSSGKATGGRGTVKSSGNKSTSRKGASSLSPKNGAKIEKSKSKSGSGKQGKGGAIQVQPQGQPQAQVQPQTPVSSQLPTSTIGSGDETVSQFLGVKPWPKAEAPVPGVSVPETPVIASPVKGKDDEEGKKAPDVKTENKVAIREAPTLFPPSVPPVTHNTTAHQGEAVRPAGGNVPIDTSPKAAGPSLVKEQPQLAPPAVPNELSFLTAKSKSAFPAATPRQRLADKIVPFRPITATKAPTAVAPKEMAPKEAPPAPVIPQPAAAPLAPSPSNTVTPSHPKFEKAPNGPPSGGGAAKDSAPGPVVREKSKSTREKEPTPQSAIRWHQVEPATATQDAKELKAPVVVMAPCIPLDEVSIKTNQIEVKHLNPAETGGVTVENTPLTPPPTPPTPPQPPSPPTPEPSLPPTPLQPAGEQLSPPRPLDTPTSPVPIVLTSANQSPTAASSPEEASKSLEFKSAQEYL